MKKTILLVPLLVATYSIHAQSIGPSIINSAGGTAVIGSNEFEWSIGEMALVSTFSTPGIIVTQGLLQPADANLGIKNTSLLNGQIQVFPNPATSEVNLMYTASSAGTLNYRLMDMTGKIIADQGMKVEQGTTSEKINVSDLVCATYMLEIVINQGNSGSEKTSYKIQKLK